MLLEDFDECINSTFDPFEVENVYLIFQKLELLAFQKN